MKKIKILLSKIGLLSSCMILGLMVNSSAGFAAPDSAIKWNSRGANDIAPGFLVRLSSTEDHDINGEFRIDFNGRLVLPYGVTMETTGKTEDQLRSTILSSYQKFFRSAPNIQVSIAEKKYWVDVRGLVDKAGQYLVSRNSSLDEIISKAGALRTNTETKVKYVKIEQLGVSALINLDDYYRGTAAGNIPQWQGGDIIFFQSQGETKQPAQTVSDASVQILGQVVNPGEYRVKSGADFLYYLVQAGGPNDRSDMSKIEIIRIVNGKKEVLPFKLEDTTNLPEILGGDVVIVHNYQEDRGIMNFTSIVTAITSIALLFLV